MIYVQVRGKKSEGHDAAPGGNGWHDTDNVMEAVVAQLAQFERTWRFLGPEPVTTYTITATIPPFASNTGSVAALGRASFVDPTPRLPEIEIDNDLGS